MALPPRGAASDRETGSDGERPEPSPGLEPSELGVADVFIHVASTVACITSVLGEGGGNQRPIYSHGLMHGSSPLLTLIINFPWQWFSLMPIDNFPETTTRI